MAPPGGGPMRTKLVLLGTNGGPLVRLNRSSPAQAIMIDNVAYLVDCGEGTVRQLVAAGIPLEAVQHIFITHHHADHNLGYGSLLLVSWATGLASPLTVHGPPPLANITEAFLAMNAYDLETRAASTGRQPLAEGVRVEEFSEGGIVLEDDRVRVTAARVDHPPVDHAYAFRFDGPDRSIVISGDTAPSDSLVRLATGADVLVHEVLYLPAVERVAGELSLARTLTEHLTRCHTNVEDVGNVAAAAGVGTLVLSHFVPGDDSVSDDEWARIAQRGFDGEVVVGRDLLSL